MSETHEGCAVCGDRAPQGSRMSKVVVEGRALALCKSHTAAVVEAMPETFEDLRALFVGLGVDLGADDAARPASERRSPIERRAALDG